MEMWNNTNSNIAYKSITMRTILQSVCLFLAIMAMVACGGKDKTETGPSADTQRDSVMAENERLNEFLNIVASSMDSINGREQMIFVTREGVPLSRKRQIRDNLRVFEYTLNEQRRRIAELEKQLGQRDDARSRQFRTIIAGLQQQIEEKEAMIAQLRSELDSKNADITTLKGHVSRLNADVATLTEENTAKTEDLRSANEEIAKMSTGYVLIGTKKQLSATGVLKGGFLTKKKVDLSSVDNSKFRSVDTRQHTDFTVAGKDVKVLTAHPQSSYTLEVGSGSTTLHVTNASAFWGASRYLIIQHK